MVQIGLAAELAEIADDFLDEFGGSISYTPAGGSAATITGIFMNPHEETVINDIVYSASTYSVIVKTSEITSVALNDAVTVESVVYSVIDIQNMQTGLTKLELQT